MHYSKYRSGYEVTNEKAVNVMTIENKGWRAEVNLAVALSQILNRDISPRFESKQVVNLK